MNQLFAVALGGSFGAVLRFLVSTGVYHWLGRGFPYGTLVVNVLGSFLLGLLTEALVLNRIAFALDYRAAILVGFIGAFTTFSTFSLETVYLLEQNQFSKAALNIAVNVVACLLAIWLGLLCGKALAGKAIVWAGGIFPYGIIIVNVLGALLISSVSSLLLLKVPMAIEQQLTLVIVMAFAYLGLSGLYVLLHLLEHGYSYSTHERLLMFSFAANTFACLLVMWLGWLAVKPLTNFCNS
ncbi:MAG: fluoride efflux transporter CrcB [Methylovulum sp.]|uniref:fluoride efflux transporter CrcB n=1 Tax=Methylovulum sp. TaxID=1916980 RepID=UPI00263261F4|nr:fluoride efflux transporter CrcB [Methylovulum sp.]MDD2722954.1 fluoride efflux transporter CrcB [Methylovulum sp.]MDD5123267.1 fluoride efflux transporter CrcB [Methylovulum sp.]